MGLAIVSVVRLKLRRLRLVVDRRLVGELSVVRVGQLLGMQQRDLVSRLLVNVRLSPRIDSTDARHLWHRPHRARGKSHLLQEALFQ